MMAAVTSANPPRRSAAVWRPVNDQTTTAANHVIKNEIPQIPVTEASWASTRLFAWVYGSENQLPYGVIQRWSTSSVVTHASGNTSV